ncbi:hypothetical protein C8F01DRAFT_1371567 [Mycena amicta]|nr:hypothetical protein C8F01DRAFT_1371567 [Mycena amicta]
MFPVEKRVVIPRTRPLVHRPAVLLVVALILASPWLLSKFDNVSLPKPHILARPNSTLRWASCPDNSTFYCTFFPVPLDYDVQDNADKAVLALRMYPATVPLEERLGTIMTNPGGPGGSGHRSLLNTGPLVSNIFEGKFDILGWDPRGINLTTPKVSCHPTNLNRELYNLGDELGDFNSAPTANHNQTLLVAAARAELFTELCRSAVGDKVLRSVTTVNVARDMEEIRKALGEGGLNYWGFSYGTTLGATYVAMFPDQAERVILDGVVYAPEQYTSVYDHGMSAGVSTNGVFEGFLANCVVAGPERCALITESATTIVNLSARISDLAERLHTSPLPIIHPHSGFPALLHRKHLLDAIFSAMYRPSSWSTLASAIADAELRADGSPLAEMAWVAGAQQDWVDLRRNQTDQERAEESGWGTWGRAVGASFDKQYALGMGPDEAGAAVSCGDAPAVPVGNGTAWTEEWLTWLEELTDPNPLNGPSWFAKIVRCSFWGRIEPPPARYEGEWEMGGDLMKPKNPVVFVSNSFDPITPISSGRRMVNLFGKKNARLLTNDGFGHCSTNHPSTCIAKALRAWVVDGILFDEGTVCKPDEGVDLMFPRVNATTSASSSEEEEDEDTRLARTMRLLADVGVDGSLHQDKMDKAEAQKAKIVNHLSTLFSRGKVAGEGNRNIAVVGSVLVNETDVIVASELIGPSPTSSPTTVSPSSSNSSALEQSENMLPVPLGRNSACESETDGNFSKIIIPTGENYGEILRQATAQKTPAFPDFVELSVRLLRAGGACFISAAHDDPIRSQVAEEVVMFFVKSCFPKIKARFDAIRHTYGELASLKDWTPVPNDSVEPTTTVFESPWIESIFEDASIPFTFTEMPSRNLTRRSVKSFTFNKDNASRWWGCLVDMLTLMGSAIETQDFTQIASISERIHRSLPLFPQALWRMDGLSTHLEMCRRSNENHQAESTEDVKAEQDVKEEDVKAEEDAKEGDVKGEEHVEGEEDVEEENVEEEDVEEEEEELSTDALPQDSGTGWQVEARAFVSAADAACAWTTAAMYLLKHRIAKSTVPLVVSLVDLPRGKIKQSPREALINHWRSVASEPWSEDTALLITKKLRNCHEDLMAKTTKAEATNVKGPIPAKLGQCHCEVGLISSIYLRQKNLLDDLPPEKREPQVVAEAFANFAWETSGPCTVGVAKKCCPICKLVITILRGRQFDLNISGAHSRYHPWVPPEWLPDDILVEVETKLVERMTALLVRPSRASSPTSDGDRSSLAGVFPVEVLPEAF